VSVRAFGPGRVNLIGEHTDYNSGLALPFAIDRGVTVTAAPLDGDRVEAHAADLDETDAFPLADPRGTSEGATSPGATSPGATSPGATSPGATSPGATSQGATSPGATSQGATSEPGTSEGGDSRGDTSQNTSGTGHAGGGGWRAFVRGVVGELQAAGYALRPARLEITGNLPRGSGLSSSAALSTALCLALLALAEEGEPADRRELARLCSIVENVWVGAETGLLDQIASLCAQPGHAVKIDFATLELTQVPLELGDWRLVTLDSGAEHVHAGSGYNERRAECEATCDRLAIASLRDARPDDIENLPAPLDRRVRHVLTENARVDAMTDALRRHDLPAVGALLDASHASLRDDYEVSVPAVEAAVQTLKQAGAAGARIVGGGFGGSVLGLLPPGAEPPPGAFVVTPGAPARLLPPRA
jgi:galactokinase